MNDLRVLGDYLDKMRWTLEFNRSTEQQSMEQQIISSPYFYNEIENLDQVTNKLSCLPIGTFLTRKSSSQVNQFTFTFKTEHEDIYSFRFQIKCENKIICDNNKVFDSLDSLVNDTETVNNLKFVPASVYDQLIEKKIYNPHITREIAIERMNKYCSEDTLDGEYYWLLRSSSQIGNFALTILLPSEKVPNSDQPKSADGKFIFFNEIVTYSRKNGFQIGNNEPSHDIIKLLNFHKLILDKNIINIES